MKSDITMAILATTLIIICANYFMQLEIENASQTGRIGKIEYVNSEL